MFVLHLLLFIVCLSVLVVVHELGHLAAAKAFKVYCFEFSVGFGPAIFRRKRKRGETYVAFRIVPFGGFVSMYGENDANSDQLPDGIEPIPANRSLANIKAWKKLIIMAAGVTLNAVLALVLLFSSNMFFVQQEMYVRNISVKEESIAYNAGIRNGDVLLPYGFNDMNNIPEDAYNAYTGDSKNNQNFYILDKYGLLYFEDTTLAPKQVAVLLNVNPYVLTLKNSSYDNKISLYELDDQGLVNFTTLITLSEGNYSYIEFDLHFKSAVAETLYLTDLVLGSENVSAKQIDQAFTLSAGTALTTNDKVEFEVASAARVSLTTKNGTKIYEQEAIDGSSTNAGNDLGFDTVNGAFEYYNKKSYTTGSDGTVQGNLSAEGVVEPGSVIAVDDITDTNTTTVALDGVNPVTITVRVWIEGWDGECMNFIFDQILSVQMSFRFGPATTTPSEEEGN